MAFFSQNEFVFCLDQLDANDNNADQYDENELLDKDDQYYFSKDQYFSPVKRGVVELDDKIFKIYTQALLHYKRPEVELEDIYADGMQVSSIYMNKTTLLQYVEKQFNTIVDQEIEQKGKALDSLYSTLTHQFPGFFVPKLSKRQKKIVLQGLPSEKREIVKSFIIRLSDYQYLIQHPAFKAFIEKKMEIKKHLNESSSLGADADPIEVAERFRDVFAYLMEIELKDNEIKIIDQFDQFIKAKFLELTQVKRELKILLSKCVGEFKVEGKITHQKIQKQRDEIQRVMNFIDDEINELDVSLSLTLTFQSFKDAIFSLKKYLNIRNQLRYKMAKSVDHYNNYIVSKNIEVV